MKRGICKAHKCPRGLHGGPVGVGWYLGGGEGKQKEKPMHDVGIKGKKQIAIQLRQGKTGEAGAQAAWSISGASVLER